MGQSSAQRVCSNCGTPDRTGDQYCANCGFALDSTTTSTIASNSNAATLASLPGRRGTGTLTAQDMLGGRYHIIRLIGKGGFGAVYQATDERFKGKRQVAIKEMSDAHLSPSERARAIDNFRQEADILVGLKHPNLPDVSDFLEEGGKAYLVMEFVDGQTLEKIQEDAKAPLDQTLVMGWALQLCDVLDYLHTQPQPIIFRDLKPPNIMLTRTNQIKLIDFGIARIFKSTSAKDTETLGSQGYAPLEQYGRGQSDARSDIYALGATMYDLMTNTVPVPSPLRRIQGLPAPRQLNPQLSPGVEQVILKAMEEMPDQRYQSAIAMYDAITRLGYSTGRVTGPGLVNSSPGNVAPTLVGNPITPVPPTFPNLPQPGGGGASFQPPPSQKRISRRGLLIGGVAVVAAGAGLYAVTHHSGSVSNNPTSTPQPAGATINIDFVCSTEKQDWMQAVSRSFNASNTRYNGKAIQVNVNYLGSVDSQSQLLSGQLKSAIWSPASNLEINRLNYKWQQAHGGQSIISSSADFQPLSLVRSPLVLASWPERAQALLKHFNVQTLDWDTLASALQAQSWSDVGGQAGWTGPVKFDQTLPTQSNSGLLTITLIAYHYFNEERGLTKAQVADAKFWKFLHIFDDAVYAFGHSTGTHLTKDIIPEGPAVADVIATYENLALTLPNRPLTIYYPQVNILSDHPFVILQGDWVTNDQKQAALVFRNYLLDVPQQKQAMTYGFRPGNASLSLSDSSIPNNPFIGQNTVFGNGQPDNLQNLAQPPAGDVVDALIANWNEQYPGPNVANG